MSMEEPQQDAPPLTDGDTAMQDASNAPAPTAAAAAAGKKRPRLDLGALGERKRGKSMFGVLVNTLNKAKAEDKERNASEAAKKRQLIEQRLQKKLRKETDSVRQAEEAKKDKLTANRKEEDLQLKDSIHKLRRSRLPLLSKYLCTSDVIPTNEVESDTPAPFQLSSLLPPRSHPPPLYYLPAILTPEQEAFLSKRKEQAKDVVEKEWEEFKAERSTGIGEILSLRRKLADLEEAKKREKEGAKKEQQGANGTPAAVDEEERGAENGVHSGEDNHAPAETKDAEMEVDDGERDHEPEKKDERPSGDEDDAVEY